MIVYLWFLLHLSFISWLFIKRSSILAIFFLPFFFYFLIDKNYSYDIHFWYLDYFLSPYNLEPVFYQTTVFLKYLGVTPRYILFFWQTVIFIGLMFSSYKIIIPESNYHSKIYLAIMISLLVLFSIFFFLTTQNALRQGASTSIILLGFSFLISKNYRTALFYFVLGVLTHKSGIILVIPLIVWFILDSHSYSRRYFFIVPLFLGLFILISAHYFLPSDSVYLEERFWGEERSSSTTKFFAVTTLFFISQFLVLKGDLSAATMKIVSLRSFFYTLIIPLSFSHEFFARVLYFYYGIEAVFTCVGFVNSSNLKQKLGFLLPILSAGIAPNVINILLFSP